MEKKINLIGINGYIKIKYVEVAEFNPSRYSKMLLNTISIKTNEVQTEGKIEFSRLDLKQLSDIFEKVIKKKNKEYTYNINATLNINIVQKTKDYILLYGEFASYFGLVNNEMIQFVLMMTNSQIMNAINDMQKYIDSND